MVERTALTAQKPEANVESPVSRIQEPELSQFTSSPIDRIMFLQKTYGNQAVNRLLKSHVIQAKLKVGEPGDKYEQEADRVAEQVVASTPQHKCTGKCSEDEEKKLIQRKTEGTSDTTNTHVADSFVSNLGPGKPLDPAMRAFFEPRFGHDFSGVRVHTDAKASEMARAVNAKAFTVGRNMVFDAGEYSPNSTKGKKLLGHELTHVTQQQIILHGIKKHGQLVAPAPMIQFQKAKKASRLKVHGADTKENVYRFLANLKRTLPGFSGLTTGRIIGNKLEYGDRKYELYSSINLEDLTISSKLGEGTFFFDPVPRTRLGVVALMNGAAYEIYQVSPSGTLYRTGIEVITASLGSITEGILVYSPRTLYMAEVKIEARRPRNTFTLARHVIRIMDDAGSVLNPGFTVAMLMDEIQSKSITNEEMMELLQKLKQLGRLGEFLNLVRIRSFREFLLQKGVEWHYIYENWEPSFNDSGLFYTGYLIGAGESVWDVIRLIGILTGVTEDLSKERAKLFAASMQFLAHPITSTVQVLQFFKSSIEEALWNLDYFEAGRIFGNLVVVILTLPEAIRALPKAARAVAKVAVKVGRMTLQAAKKLGITLRNMVNFVRQPVPSVVLDNGIILMKAGDEMLVLDKTGSPMGRIVPKEFSPAEIAEWERTLKEPVLPPKSEKTLMIRSEVAGSGARVRGTSVGGDIVSVSARARAASAWGGGGKMLPGGGKASSMANSATKATTGTQIFEGTGALKIAPVIEEVPAISPVRLVPPLPAEAPLVAPKVTPMVSGSVGTATNAGVGIVAAAGLKAITASKSKEESKKCNKNGFYPLLWPIILPPPTQVTFTRVHSDRDEEFAKKLRGEKWRRARKEELRGEELVPHHIVPLFLGGTENSPSNIILWNTEVHRKGHKCLLEQPQMIKPPPPLCPLPSYLLKHPYGTRYRLVGYKVC